MKKIISALLVLILLTGMCMLPTNALLVTTATIQKAVDWAIDTANDDSHGYSQYHRWGDPDYDCASFVICAYRHAGFELANAVHCGNMKEAFIEEGFEWIPNTSIDLSTSKYLKPGDVLLRVSGHTEIYIGDNTQVGAHEGTYDDYDLNDPGDSTGKEICPVKYSNNNNWSGILRYPVDPPVDIGTDFYGYIMNNATQKFLTNDNPNVSVRSLSGEGMSNQVWKFERQSDNSYVIRSCADNKVLNVSYSGTTPDTNVGVYKNANKPSRRWFFYGTQDKYRIKPKLVDLALHIKEGSLSSPEGTNVCLWDIKNTSKQTFKIIPLSTPDSAYVQAQPGTSSKPTTLYWNMTLSTKTYDVLIYKDGIIDGELFLEFKDIVDTQYLVDLPAGEYEFYVISKNSFSQTESMNSVAFTVEEDGDGMLGDVDCDKEISVIDATQIQLFLAQRQSLSQKQQALGDTDRDGYLSIIDANIIQQYVAKRITEF